MASRFGIGFLLLAAVTAVAWVARASDGWTMFDRRVGMFVHWGIYSAGGYHEQERMRLYVPRAEYAKYASRFTAENFSADAFVDAAESLGAEYIVFTAKHHDGFCMWNTKTTGFNVMNTPAKRDIIGELAAACRRRGMKLGFYYSNPDWNHPNAYNPKSTHQVSPLRVLSTPSFRCASTWYLSMTSQDAARRQRRRSHGKWQSRVIACLVR